MMFFSFRFRGSLVESINIDKMESPTLQKIIATQQYADSILGHAADISPKKRKGN
jgi:hypothetical protein